MRNSLYIALTPLQVLLVTALAHSRRAHERAHVLVMGQFPAYREYAEILRSLPDAPFATVDTLEGHKSRRYAANPNEKPPPLAKLFKLRRMVTANLRKIRRLVDDVRPERVWVSNDFRRETQYAIHRAKRRNPRAIGTYFDDGMASYTEGPHRRLSRSRRLIGAIRKRTWAPWFEQHEKHAASRWIDEAHVIAPHLVSSALRAKPVSPITLEQLRSPAVASLADALLAAFRVDASRIGSAQVVYLLSLSSKLGKDTGYRDTIRRVHAHLRRRSVSAAFKYHPREFQADFCGISDGDALMIPSNLPFEFVLPLLDARRAIVLGDTSSSLMLCKWLRPDVEAVSLNLHFSNRETATDKVFHELGVDVEDARGRDIESVLDDILESRAAVRRRVTPEVASAAG
jgi:hypothetical protein